MSEISQLKRQRFKKKYRKLLSSDWNVAFSEYIDKDIDLYIYVVHLGTGLIKLLGLCYKKDGAPSPLSLNELANHASTIIHMYATEEYKQVMPQTEMLPLLASLVGEYAKKTQSFQIASELAQTGTPRLLVMHMDDPLDKRACYLRPNPLEDRDHAPEELAEIAQAVLAQDRMNHPERFKSAEIIEFKAKKIEI